LLQSTTINHSKGDKVSSWADHARNIFILSWTAAWLYLSLGMVLLSFSAIQFQTEVADNARRDYNENTDTETQNTGLTLKVTIAEIKLQQTHYQEDKNSLTDLLKQANSLSGSASGGDSIPVAPLGEITQALYPKLFTTQDPPPANVVEAITRKCADPSLDEATKQQCASFKEALTAAYRSPLSSQLEAINSKMSELRSRIRKYERSSVYSEADDIDGYKRMSEFIFPWLPADILLPALPHPILVMIVTLSMGALGSALFMLQLHLAGESGPGYRMSISWHLFRPLQGMAVALAILLLVRAGQISVSHTPDVGDTDLNAFVLGFLGVLSGLLSDRAMDRLTAAGVDLFRTADTRSQGSNDRSATNDEGDKPDKPRTDVDNQQVDSPRRDESVRHQERSTDVSAVSHERGEGHGPTSSSP
jgi:hypothetical protein